MNEMQGWKGDEGALRWFPMLAERARKNPLGLKRNGRCSLNARSQETT